MIIGVVVAEGAGFEPAAGNSPRQVAPAPVFETGGFRRSPTPPLSSTSWTGSVLGLAPFAFLSFRECLSYQPIGSRFRPDKCVAVLDQSGQRAGDGRLRRWRLEQRLQQHCQWDDVHRLAGVSDDLGSLSPGSSSAAADDHWTPRRGSADRGRRGGGRETPFRAVMSVEAMSSVRLASLIGADRKYSRIVSASMSSIMPQRTHGDHPAPAPSAWARLDRAFRTVLTVPKDVLVKAEAKAKRARARKRARKAKAKV